jgi:hypothetical protein
MIITEVRFAITGIVSRADVSVAKVIESGNHRHGVRRPALLVGRHEKGPLLTIEGATEHEHVGIAVVKIYGRCFTPGGRAAGA